MLLRLAMRLQTAKRILSTRDTRTVLRRSFVQQPPQKRKAIIQTIALFIIANGFLSLYIFDIGRKKPEDETLRIKVTHIEKSENPNSSKS